MNSCQSRVNLVMNSCQYYDSRGEGKLCWCVYYTWVVTVLCMSTEPLLLRLGRSRKKVRTWSGKNGPCPDFCFFGPPFSDFFWAQGGPKVDFVYHKTGEIAYLELSEVRSPGCEYIYSKVREQSVFSGPCPDLFPRSPPA